MLIEVLLRGAELVAAFARRLKRLAPTGTYGDDEAPPFAELIDERWGDFLCGGRDDDPVVGGSFGPTFSAITADQLDVVDA